jgi:SPP1 gp7 family putative phage head morphogenesis protein
MAKREISKEGGGEIKAPEPMKSVERELAAAMDYMVSEMAARWRNQVFKELNQNTIEKFATQDSGELIIEMEHRGFTFADAQVGNFANVFLKMADKTRRKLIKQFDDKRLEKLAKKMTGKVDKRNKSEFYRRVSESIGIGQQELEATEGLTFQINAYQLETYQWIRKMRDETMQDWTSNTLRMMSEGKGLPDILSQFDGMVEKRKGHAKMVARTQISTFNSLVSKTRARNLGIEKAVWVTSRDERVRTCHQVRDGKEFDLAEGLYSSCDGKTLLPGTDFSCRCDYKMLIPTMDEEQNG